MAHQQTYVLPARWSDDPNEELADDEAQALGLEDGSLQPVEVKFQLSFKIRLLRDLPRRSALWLAYTQQSFWQAYDVGDSSPFRETNYEPEAVWSLPLGLEALGWEARFVNLGAVHQSNGRGDRLSRSWNRVYAQLPLERGDVSILLRPWLVVGDDGDNPDIERYLGYGDLTAVWTRARHQVGIVLRNNLDLEQGRGAVQADWSWGPEDGPRIFVQVFSGYGESLMDYDHAQTTIGVGLALSDRL